MTKYIFFTGGVVSSIGKGITSASLGMLLKSRGLNVGVLKIDPYFNPDPSTMTPYQHGEVYVTDDGSETDLALGHYERFMNVDLTAASSTTLGRIYRQVLDKERAGFYGGTVFRCRGDWDYRTITPKRRPEMRQQMLTPQIQKKLFLMW